MGFQVPKVENVGERLLTNSAGFYMRSVYLFHKCSHDSHINVRMVPWVGTKFHGETMILLVVNSIPTMAQECWLMTKHCAKWWARPGVVEVLDGCIETRSC